jgi:predicted  nucleic acid-binding Zn-ribbon protein
LPCTDLFAIAQTGRGFVAIVRLHPRKFSTNRNPSMSNRSAYIAKMKLQLDELNASMGKLETRAQEVKDEARDMYREEMRKLRHQSKLALAKFEEVKAAGEDSWETMTVEMEKVQLAFSHSFNYFKSQL